MKWDKANGCGASTGIMRFIPVPHANFFKEACLRHDVRYNIGGTETERQIADKLLYHEMVRTSIDYFGDRIQSQFWFICWAYLYYKAVRWFAKKQFNYKTEQ